MRAEIHYSHFLLAVLPACLAPVVFFALAEGWISAGGGEKDILLAFVYAFWSLIFLITAFILIVKQWRLWKWVYHAGVIATLVLMFCGFSLYLAGISGIA